MAGVPLVAPLSNYAAPVHIDVGGTNYTSCLETLTKFPQSKLAKLFNGTLPITVDPTKQQYFLDRDGKVFRHILNYLRNGELTLPDHFTDTNLLLKEATFFDLNELCDTITAVTSEQQGGIRETGQSDGDSSYEETETEIQRHPGRRSRKRRKKNKQQGAADEVEETQGLSTAAVEDQQGIVQPASPYQEKMENLYTNEFTALHPIECCELICVEIYNDGSVKCLLCSDQQFKVQLPEPLLNTYINKYSHLMTKNNCNYINVKSSDTIGCSWLAKYLFQKGYRMISCHN